MLKEHVEDLLDAALVGHHLLTHPFYRRWEAGELAPRQLAEYAGQYRHVEAVFPVVLADIVGGLRAGTARDLVAANLRDEMEPVPHLRLFDEFAEAVGGADAAEPTAATAALVGCYRSAASGGPIPGLAALGAYEVQSASIASTKGDGLRRHYGIGGTGTRFWDLHAEVDAIHADWTVRALAELVSGERDVVGDVAALAAGAWWDFLSERESLAPSSL